MPNPIPQLNWTLAGAIAVGFTFLGVLVRQIVPWKKVTTDAEAKLRDMLITRVERLESKLERQQARYAAKDRLGTHRLRNITACFDAMLMMLEMNPDRAPEIITKIKEMRSAQMVAEAQESAIIRAAEITADEADEAEKVTEVGP